MRWLKEHYGEPVNTYNYSNYPSSGWNGNKVIAYNLDGDFERNTNSTRWATTPVIDCSNHKNTKLVFHRWLGVYEAPDTQATIQVYNGSNWTTVWENSTRLTNYNWELLEYDISSIADSQSNVKIRWGLYNDSYYTNSGWYLDFLCRRFWLS